MLKTKKNFYNEVEKIREFYKFEILEINTIDEIRLQEYLHSDIASSMKRLLNLFKIVDKY